MEEIQVLPGDWHGHVKVFEDGGFTYLVVGASATGCEASSKLFRLDPADSQFKEAASFTTWCPTDFDTFLIAGVTHLVVCNSQADRRSEIFSWSNGALTSVQALPTLRYSQSVRAFTIQGDTADDIFIAFSVLRGTTGSYIGEGVVCKLSGSTFAKLQDFDTSGGLDVQHVEMGGEHFLIAGNAYKDNPDNLASWLPAEATVLRWDGALFVKYFVLPTSAPRCVRPVVIFGATFLVSTNRHTSKVTLHHFTEPVVFQHLRFRPERTKNDPLLKTSISELAFFYKDAEVSLRGSPPQAPGLISQAAASAPTTPWTGAWTRSGTRTSSTTTRRTATPCSSPSRRRCSLTGLSTTRGSTRLARRAAGCWRAGTAPHG